MDDNARDRIDLSPLQNELSKAYASRFGVSTALIYLTVYYTDEIHQAPFTGRIGLMIPFLPFSLVEQAVVFHKFFLDLKDQKCKPIDLRPDVKHTINHINLTILNDGKACLDVAKKYFQSDMGARSFIRAVDDVTEKLTQLYIDTDKLVSEETNSGSLQRYTVHLLDDGAGSHEIAVFENRSVQEENSGTVSSPMSIDE